MTDEITTKIASNNSFTDEKVVSSISEHTTTHGAIAGKTQTRMIGKFTSCLTI